ncbi:MAG: DnaD domain protein [Candidatus Izemoplasmatales bacterium]|nr:DnaD domain protein [Candidatus Izemoplasmatales bacterium]
MEGLRSGDRFIVSAKSVVSSQDYQTLTLLYLPIIGKEAFVLYCAMTSLLDRQRLTSSEYFHSDLESVLNQPVQQIEKARQRLEASGLLETYYLEDQFVYELIAPFSPSQFVNDGVMGEYLIHAVTKERFKKLINVFKTKNPSHKGYLRLTKSFDEIFSSIHSDSQNMESDLISAKTSGGIRANHDHFEWRLLEESLPEELATLCNLKKTKSQITNLAYVYGIPEIEMAVLVQNTYDEIAGVLDTVRLASAVRNQFNLEKVSKEDSDFNVAGPNTEIDSAAKANPDQIQYFKNISPAALLMELEGDANVITADLRIAERLINEVHLDKGVTNVLLAHIHHLKKGDMPTYVYFEKIARSWKRNQVTSVEVALDYLKHLKSQYQKNQNKPVESKGKKEKPDVQVDWLDAYYDSIE